MSALYDFTRKLAEISDNELGELQGRYLDKADELIPRRWGTGSCSRWRCPTTYGEPVWKLLSPARQRQLNHLTFCDHYYNVMLGETAISILDWQSTYDSLAKGNDADAAFYMAREALEESFHSEAFHRVVTKVRSHYGVPVSSPTRHDGAWAWAAYYRLHTLAGWVRGDRVCTTSCGFRRTSRSSPWTRDGAGAPHAHPIVQTILRSHVADEGRHMQMSRETGKRALAAMGRIEQYAACVAYAEYVARLNVSGRKRREQAVVALEQCGLPRAKRPGPSWTG